MAGSGAISAPLRYALPDMPPIVIGKPNKPFLDSIEKLHKLDRSRTIMVGDRLDTDVSEGLRRTLMLPPEYQSEADCTLTEVLNRFCLG